eukprot:scaffold333696_cov42-Prasinocladus_malaysianus.AAC.1
MNRHGAQKIGTQSVVFQPMLSLPHIASKIATQMWARGLAYLIRRMNLVEARSSRSGAKVSCIQSGAAAKMGCFGRQGKREANPGGQCNIAPQH